MMVNKQTHSDITIEFKYCNSLAGDKQKFCYSATKQSSTLTAPFLIVKGVNLCYSNQYCKRHGQWETTRQLHWKSHLKGISVKVQQSNR